MTMSYEQFLDEVTTLIHERHDLGEKASIRIVMQAQADDYFSPHDEDPALRTQQRAEQDAEAIFARYGRPPAR